MANSTVPVLTQRTKTCSAATALLVDAAVKTQVNTLVQSYTQVHNTGATSGGVQNGSITISPTSLVLTSADAQTWLATVQWNEFLIPT